MATVSVILPCFNHARFVTQAINGILSQGYRDLELIIVEDRSSDDSWEVITQACRADSRIKAIRHSENRGLAASRNDGLRLATGQYIAFCDSDDIWEKDKLETQVGLLESSRFHDITYSDSVIINEGGVATGERFSDIYPLPKKSSGLLFGELVKRNFINVQSGLIRRQCLASLSHFDEDLRVLEDWWYWLQLSKKHSFLYCEKPLARYRVHSGSLNAMQRRAFPMCRFKIYRRVLAKYSDLDTSTQAQIFFNMGAALCDLGKIRIGRRLLWRATGMAAGTPWAFASLCKALRRLILRNSCRYRQSLLKEKIP